MNRWKREDRARERRRLLAFLAADVDRVDQRNDAAQGPYANDNQRPDHADTIGPVKAGER